MIDMTIDEYKYTVLVDGQSFVGYLKVPQTQMTIFGRKVLAYIELSNLLHLEAGVKKVTIEWPTQVFPHVLNPSNIVFKLDDEYILQHGIIADIYNRKTEHIIAIGNQITNLHVYVFNDSLCQTEKTAYGCMGDIKECNTYTLNFPRSYNEYATTECNTYTIIFPRSCSEYPTTECNTYTITFPLSFNTYPTTECNSFTVNFPRSFDYSISLE